MTKEPKFIHRRRFLQRSAVAMVALDVVPAHANSFKASQKLAGYIERDHAESQMCLQCHSFLPPTDCTLVEGPVSPWGWCNYYSD